MHPDAKTARPTRSRTAPRPRGLLALILAVLTTSAAIEATTTPKPGHEFPQSFVDFRNANPELFEIQGGLKGKVERARLERQLFFQSGGAKKKLTDGELEKMTVSGTIEVPVVPVLFTPNTVPVPPTAAALDAILFAGPNPTGTVTQYYDENSYGLLNLTGTVFAYTTLPQADTFYEGGNNGLPIVLNSADKVGLLMQHALNVLDTTVNFGQYDNDGPDNVPNSGDDDGVVDLISFLHSEAGGECGFPNQNNIWSHRWIYSGWFGGAYTTNDPANGGGSIRIDDYNIQGALDCNGTPMKIGTFAHETGHIFGIPDLYDTGQTGPSQGVGHWSLMASGNWNTQESPAHMSAWEKTELGWLIPTLLTAPANSLSIPEVETNPVAYQVVVGNGEYFLIENRQPVGFDQHLHTCGLAIWHVDQATIEAQTATNSVNNMQNCGAFVQNPNLHYGLALEQADGLCHLEANVNRGDAGDLFPGSTNNTSLTAATNPDSDSYVSGPTLVEVTNISNCGATMTADVDAVPIPPTTGPVDVVFLIDNTGSYANDWPNIQAQMPGIVAKLQSNFIDIRYGLALFRDFPFWPFGGGSDFAYQEVLPLTTSSSAFLTAIATLQSPGGGADLPESQYEAVHQLLFGLGRDLHGDAIPGNQPGEIAPSNIGWVPARHRVIYLLTDASFHDSDTENYPTGTTTPPIPILEAEGRNAVRSQVATLMNTGVGMTLFTLVAEHAGSFVTQGRGRLGAPRVAVRAGGPGLGADRADRRRGVVRRSRQLRSRRRHGRHRRGAEPQDPAAALHRRLGDPRHVALRQAGPPRQLRDLARRGGHQPLRQQLAADRAHLHHHPGDGARVRVRRQRRERGRAPRHRFRRERKGRRSAAVFPALRPRRVARGRRGPRVRSEVHRQRQAREVPRQGRPVLHRRGDVPGGGLER